MPAKDIFHQSVCTAVEEFFSRQFIQDAIAEYKIKLLIFDSLKQIAYYLFLPLCSLDLLHK